MSMRLPLPLGWVVLVLVGMVPTAVPRSAPRPATADPQAQIVPAASAIPEPATLRCRGRVIDARRFPVAGARVKRLQRGLDRLDGSESVTTAADGSFTLLMLAPRVSPDDSTLALLVVEAGGLAGASWVHHRIGPQTPMIELDQPIVLRPSVSARVKVSDSRGAVAGAQVRIGGWSDQEVLASATTDAQGVARFESLPQEFAPAGRVISAQHPERGLAFLSAEESLAGELALELRPFRSLQIEVVDVDQQQPIVGALVRVRREGPIRGWHQDFAPLTASPLVTDANGRVELHDLPIDTPLLLNADADHCANMWDKSPGSACGTDRIQRTAMLVEPGQASARLELKRLVPRMVRWALRPAAFAPPPVGTRLELRRWFPAWDSGERFQLLPQYARVGDGFIEAAVEIDPRVDSVKGHTARLEEFLAIAPDGVLARLPADPAAGTEFVRAARLAVELRTPDGSPRRDALVALYPEDSPNPHGDVRHSLAHTGADGVVEFEGVWPGRHVIHTPNILGRVEAIGSPQRVTLNEPRPREVAFEFTIDGETRLPDQFQFHVSWSDWRERIGARIEEPANGRLRCFYDRVVGGSYDHAYLSCNELTDPEISVPPFPDRDAAVFPITIGTAARGGAVVRMRGWQALNAFLSLRRIDPEAGVPSRESRTAERRTQSVVNGLDAPVPEVEFWFHHLDPGRWEVTSPALRNGPTFEVVAGAPPAEVVLDVSQWTQVALAWRLPDGEQSGHASVDFEGEPERRAVHPWFGDARHFLGSNDTSRLLFDRANPPRLRIRHPYLVSAPRNAAIDLRNPRSTLTLYLELGPLLQFTPRFAVDAAPPDAVAVSLAPADAAAELLHAVVPGVALRRGESYAIAPPPAGVWRMLIDPLMAAPRELGRHESDGDATDLGPIEFPRGTTLTVHLRAPAGLVAPAVIASVCRIDGIPYGRSSASPDDSSPPVAGHCVITGLGPGRFELRLRSRSGFEVRYEPIEVAVDGVHDSEVTIDAQ